VTCLTKSDSGFEDTRPVIVFEDFSIAAMEAERLRKYMERDKSADNWDFIVAGTRDSTEVLRTRTAEDRFEFFQTNEQDSNTVLFLNEDSAVDFVRPYLGYIKSHDGSVQYDRNTDDGTFDLKEAPEGLSAPVVVSVTNPSVIYSRSIRRSFDVSMPDSTRASSPRVNLS